MRMCGATENPLNSSLWLNYTIFGPLLVGRYEIPINRVVLLNSFLPQRQYGIVQNIREQEIWITPSRNLEEEMN